MQKILILLLLPLLFSCGKKDSKSKTPFWFLALTGSPSTPEKTKTQDINPAPSNLVFTAGSTGTNSAIITVGVAVSFTPSFSGTITNCTISPALPAGLSLNPTTCAITGIPTAPFPQTVFTITASNSTGTTTATITLTGTANPPSSLVYSSNPATFTTGVSSSLIPQYSGSISTCTISPSLPTGIVLNPTSCTISGTPTSISPQINYLVTASNAFGNTTANLNFGINTYAPQNLSFPFGASTTINSNSTVNFIPSITGGITNCTVNPILPAGLSLDPNTCAITGTPTVASSGSYTITVANSFGSTDFVLNITTTILAPINLVYPYIAGATTIYTIGTIVNVTPTITGLVTNCFSSPSLPAGLSLHSSTCNISGTPTNASSVTTYTITASNGTGSTNTSLKLQVNNIPPSNLVYPFGSSTVLAVGTAVSISPTFTGGVTSCGASPTLPTGLSINATTCTISGTPTVAKVNTAYTITASNSFGNTNVIVSITAQLFPPSALSYPFLGNAVNFTTGVAVNISATTSGIITSCTISPALPTGLSIHNTTCAITGTPTGTSVSRNYTITASNASGSINTIPTIGVNPPPPSNLVYPTSGNLAFAIGVSKTITPTKTGSITSCSSNPSLPTGLIINNTTCAISGITSAEQTSTAYAITASNAGGNTTANITIAIANPPLNLTYPTIEVYGYKNNTAMSISPTVTGNGITYSISPALPTGISINTSTGAISGTYTENEGSTGAFIVTATNSAGTTTANITLTFYGKPTFKTGQNQCYDVSGNVISCAGTGQDGEYQAGLPHAVYSGPNQHPTYTNDYTTTDTTTGLVWKTCMQGIEGIDCSVDPLLQNHQITNCQSLSILNSGSGYAGKNDWRTASLVEIYKVSLFKNFKTGFEIVFPGLQSRQNAFIKKNISPNILDPSGECYFSAFNNLDIFRSPMVSPGNACQSSGFNPLGLVRCVSGTQQEKAPQFIDKNNGINLDIATGLSWTKCRLGASGTDCQTGTPNQMNFHDASNACKNLNIGGKNWKVPNVLEALSLFNRVNYGFDYQLFPFDVTYTEDFWTSTPLTNGTSALIVSGYAEVAEKTTNNLQSVRCISTP